MCRAAIDISLLWSERRDNLRCVIHRRGEVSSSDGLGNPTPTNSIPLGLNAGASLVQRVGEPNPYEFNGVRQYHIALLWSAGVGCVALL